MIDSKSESACRNANALRMGGACLGATMYLFLLLAGVVTSATEAVSPRPVQRAPANGREWAWVHYDEALDRVMPPEPTDDSYELPAVGTAPWPRGLKWVMRLRIAPPFHGEFLADIEQHYDGSILGTVVSFTSGTLTDRLEELHDEDPSASVVNILADVRPPSWKVNSENCPQLVNIVAEFGELSISAIPNDVLYSDATRYDLTSRSKRGAVRLSIQFAPGAKQTFVTWAERTRTVLENECAAVLRKK